MSESLASVLKSDPDWKALIDKMRQDQGLAKEYGDLLDRLGQGKPPEMTGTSLVQ